MLREEPRVTLLLVDRSRWVEDLPRALIDLLRDPARRRRLGKTAREKIVCEIPTLEERQRMEVEMGLRAVKEFRAAQAAKKIPRRK